MQTMVPYTSQTGSRNKRYEPYGLKVLKFWIAHCIIIPVLHNFVSNKIILPMTWKSTQNIFQQHINKLISRTQGRFKNDFSLHSKKYLQNKTTSFDNILPRITRTMPTNEDKIEVL